MPGLPLRMLLRQRLALETARGGARSSRWRCYKQGESLDRLIAFLNPLGPREGQLLLRVQRLQRAAGGGADGTGDMHGHREEQEFVEAAT